MSTFLIIVGLILWFTGVGIYHTIPNVTNVNLAYGKMYGARFMAMGSLLYSIAFVYLNYDDAVFGHYIFGGILILIFVRNVMREHDARYDFKVLYHKTFPEENEENS